MKLGKALFAASVLALSVVPAAHAGSKIMASAPALSTYPITSQTLRCNILSLNSVPVPVTIETVDYLGTVLDTSGPITILPQTGASLPSNTYGAAYCKFTVDGSTKKYRAIATYDDGTTYTTAHAAP